jgi:amino acid adenylation domain-containing protein
VIDLPNTKPRPRIRTYNGKGLKTYLDEETTRALRKYSQENGGSLFIGLLATWKVLMYRYTGQSDVIIGTPVAGRDHADLEDQMGFYVNTLALRSKMTPHESFQELFLRIKQTTLDAYAHQTYPFDRLVNELKLKRDTSRSVVFDVSITYHNNSETTQTNLLDENLIHQISNAGLSMVKNDIELHFEEIGNYLAFDLIYNSDIFYDEMIRTVMLHFKQLLKELLRHPKVKISQINYLSKEETHEILVAFNDTKINYPKPRTIVELFEAQVAKTPDNIAIVFAEKELSYKELDKLSNQLARYIHENYQIAPDDLVGIQLDRSEWVIISILGVLKAGGAYVPIEPDLPSSRKKYIVKDTSLKLLITETNFIHDIDYYDGEVFAIDIEFDPQKYHSAKLPVIIKPQNLAYVIYTSGSTGQPKGVMIEHCAITNTLLYQMRFFEISSSDRGLQFASFSFDASVSEIFIILLSGASLFIVNTHDRNDPKLLTDFINEKALDIATLSPSYLNKIDVNQIKGLKKLITAGEPAIYEKAIQYLEFGSYYNAYGPTEASICSSIFKFEDVNSSPPDFLPIGKPVSNTEIYILNNDKQLQPKGIIGEIYLGGDGLARGYLNQENLTKEKFVENPFKVGDRLYRTGDLGVWLPDGNIKYVGRSDDQVKIRGYRVELGEVEQALLKNKEIKEAVVLNKKNQKGENELVAYITSKTQQKVGELRSFLQEILPGYMLPEYYVQIEELPLTSNGKIDKKSLPDPHGLGIPSGVEYVAPKNDIEKKLVRIWEEILQRENISVKDDFFALGGHSLKVIRMINQINKQFGLKYDLKGVYVEATVEQIARRIEIDYWFKKPNVENESDYDEIKI